MNKLKMDRDKTQILVFWSSHRPCPTLDFLDIASENVCCSTTARNTGVIFNNYLSMAPHFAAVCKSFFFHLRNIFKIRKLLSVDSAKTLVHAFITSKVDYCYSFLYGQLNVFCEIYILF